MNYLFLFDAELGISKEGGNARPETLTADHYIQMKSINRRRLCQFFDLIKSNKEAMKDISAMVVEISHGDGPGENCEIVKKRIITVSDAASNRSVNTDMLQAKSKSKGKDRFPIKDRQSFAKEW